MDEGESESPLQDCSSFSKCCSAWVKWQCVKRGGRNVQSVGDENEIEIEIPSSYAPWGGATPFFSYEKKRHAKTVGCLGIAIRTGKPEQLGVAVSMSPISWNGMR